MKKYNYLLLSFALGIAVLLTHCKKSDSLVIPPSVANFLSPASGTYTISTPTTVYKIPVAFTTVSSESRTVDISVTSPTGAMQGTHFSLSNKFVIPAGKAVDTLVLQGVYNQYTTGRKDTLVITIQQETATAPDMITKITLLMRGPCAENEISGGFAQNLPGTYATLESAFNANGSPAYTNSGPYNTTVKNVVSTSATTIDITVTSIYGVPGWEAKFTLDYADINNRKVTTTSQRLGSGSVLGLPAYDIYVEPPSATQNLPNYGNYTYCQNMINLKFRLGARDPVTGALAGLLTEQTGGGTATYIMALKK